MWPTVVVGGPMSAAMQSFLRRKLRKACGPGFQSMRKTSREPKCSKNAQARRLSLAATCPREWYIPDSNWAPPCLESVSSHFTRVLTEEPLEEQEAGQWMSVYNYGDRKAPRR